MKRCPKCNRTYATANQKFCNRDGELLHEAVVPEASVQSFDPYKTAVGQTTAPPAKTSSSLPTSAPPTPPSPPTASSAPQSQASTPRAQPLTAVPPPEKSSRGRLVVAILAVVFLLSIGVVAAAYLFLVRPMLASRTGISNSAERMPQGTPRSTATPSATPEPSPSEQLVVVAPPNSTELVNAPDNLDGKLAEHYIDFSFYYPNNWIRDPGAGIPGAINFAKVERRLPPDLTQESFAVGWYTSTGSEVSDRLAYPELVQKLGSQYQKAFPEYRKVSEGDAKTGIYQAYEFRFEAIARGTPNGDLKIWGRTVFLPPREGERTGATLLMLATSLARELESAGDVGVKGELPIILESFRLGKK